MHKSVKLLYHFFCCSFNSVFFLFQKFYKSYKKTPINSKETVLKKRVTNEYKEKETRKRKKFRLKCKGKPGKRNNTKYK